VSTVTIKYLFTNVDISHQTECADYWSNINIWHWQLHWNSAGTADLPHCSRTCKSLKMWAFLLCVLKWN